jgi:uncharacterized protein YndB with AHSA1/START domain
MTVINIDKDPDTLTLTIICEFDAPIERVWMLWADPRLLERWWGPPTYPATFVDHDLTAGGSVTYFMTGPEGDKHAGWWNVTAANPPRELHLVDGFSDANGNPNTDMPTTAMAVTLDDIETGGTRMAIASTFPTLDAMEQLIAMGMEEGIASALGQIDRILEELE